MKLMYSISFSGWKEQVKVITVMVSLGNAYHFLKGWSFLLMETKLINTLFVSVVIQSLKFGSGLSASHNIWITSSQISTR